MKKIILLFSFTLVLFLTGTFSVGATTVISDPVGDGPFVDLTQVTGGYDDENVYFSASFSPGNFQTDNLGFFFYLNTDMDATTGTGGLGTDYSLMFHQPTGTSFPPTGPSPAVAVFDTVNSMFTGRSPIAFATDFFSIIIPLTLLGGDDGEMLFTLIVGEPTFTSTGGRQVSNFDFAPTYGNGMLIALGPTTRVDPVPEPATILLLGSGLAGLAFYRRKRK